MAPQTSRSIHNNFQFCSPDGLLLAHMYAETDSISKVSQFGPNFLDVPNLIKGLRIMWIPLFLKYLRVENLYD